MGRASLSLCPKTSTFTWRKLQSTLLTLLVNETLLYLYHRDIEQVQTLPQLSFTRYAFTFQCFSLCIIKCMDHSSNRLVQHKIMTRSFFALFLLSVLRFFLEYQWLVDFAVYTAGVFIFTECYYSSVDASAEVNIGAIWCVLTVLFSLYPSTVK